MPCSVSAISYFIAFQSTVAFQCTPPALDVHGILISIDDFLVSWACVGDTYSLHSTCSCTCRCVYVTRSHFNTDHWLLIPCVTGPNTHLSPHCMHLCCIVNLIHDDIHCLAVAHWHLTVFSTIRLFTFKVVQSIFSNTCVILFHDRHFVWPCNTTSDVAHMYVRVLLHAKPFILPHCLSIGYLAPIDDLLETIPNPS